MQIKNNAAQITKPLVPENILIYRINDFGEAKCLYWLTLFLRQNLFRLLLSNFEVCRFANLARFFIPNFRFKFYKPFGKFGNFVRRKFFDCRFDFGNIHTHKITPTNQAIYQPFQQSNLRDNQTRFASSAQFRSFPDIRRATR